MLCEEQVASWMARMQTYYRSYLQPKESEWTLHCRRRSCNTQTTTAKNSPRQRKKKYFIDAARKIKTKQKVDEAQQLNGAKKVNKLLWKQAIQHRGFSDEVTHGIHPFIERHAMRTAEKCHPSHKLARIRGLIFCRKCAACSAQNLVQFAEQCPNIIIDERGHGSKKSNMLG